MTARRASDALPAAAAASAGTTRASPNSSPAGEQGLRRAVRDHGQQVPGLEADLAGLELDLVEQAEHRAPALQALARAVPPCAAGTAGRGPAFTYESGRRAGSSSP